MAVVTIAEMDGCQPLLSVDRADTGSFVVVGEIDAHTAPCLIDACDACVGDLVLDLSAVTFVDSSGLRSLLALRERAAANSAQLVLRDPATPVVRLLELAGLADHFVTESVS